MAGLIIILSPFWFNSLFPPLNNPKFSDYFAMNDLNEKYVQKHFQYSFNLTALRDVHNVTIAINGIDVFDVGNMHAGEVKFVQIENADRADTITANCFEINASIDRDQIGYYQ